MSLAHNYDVDREYRSNHRHTHTPELMHRGRDWSCYENLYVSTLNKAT